MYMRSLVSFFSSHGPVSFLVSRVGLRLWAGVVGWGDIGGILEGRGRGRGRGARGQGRWGDWGVYWKGEGGGREGEGG